MKLLLTDLEGEEQVRSRFLREVEIARLLRHRNLVTVYDAGEIDGRFFLAMELLGGRDAARASDAEARRSDSRTSSIS